MKRHAVAALVLAVGTTVGTVQGAPPTAGAAGQTASNLVIGLNETLARAALASGIAPGPDPLHESRMYTMVHLAIHDALNTIDRRSEPYAMDFGPLPDASVEAAVAVAAYEVAIPFLEELRALPAILEIDVDAARARAGGLRRSHRAGRGRPGQDPGHGDRRHRGGRDPRCPHGRWLRHRVPRRRVRGGRPARGVPLHPGRSVRGRAGLGRGQAVPVRRHRVDPPAPAARPGEPAVREGLRRAQAARGRWRRHAERSHGRRDRDRHVLVRELAPDVEPDRPHGQRLAGARHVGERPAVRPAEHGARRRLCRQLGRQVPVQPVAPADGDLLRRRRHQPMDRRRRDLGAAGAERGHAGVRLRPRHRRGRGRRGHATGARHRPRRLLRLQLHAARSGRAPTGTPSRATSNGSRTPRRRTDGHASSSAGTSATPSKPDSTAVRGSVPRQCANSSGRSADGGAGRPPWLARPSSHGSTHSANVVQLGATKPPLWWSARKRVSSPWASRLVRKARSS